MDEDDNHEKEAGRVTGRRFELIQRTLLVLQFAGCAFVLANAQFTWMPFPFAMCTMVIPLAARQCMFDWEQRARKAKLLALGFCKHCTYDRRGVEPSLPCPECGKPRE